MYLALFLIALVVFFSFAAIASANRRKKNKELRLSNEDLREIRDYKAELKFTEKQSVNLINQCFESIHVITTTKNLATFQSRLELFEKRLFQITELSKREYSYTKCYDKARDFYLSRYYDRGGLTKDMIKLKKPKEFNYDTFLESVFSKIHNRLKQETESKISTLKTEKAKQNAQIKLDEKMQDLNSIKNTFK